MKIKLDLRVAIVKELGSSNTPKPAAVDVDDLLEFNGIEEAEFDLSRILADNRLIAHVWCTEDVRTLRPDLSDDQAWEVLQAVDWAKDSEFGVSHYTLECMAEVLFGSADDEGVQP